MCSSMSEKAASYGREVLSPRLYTVAPLGLVALALILAFVGQGKLVSLPVVALLMMWLGLFSVMWEAVQGQTVEGERTMSGARATLLMALPVVSGFAGFYVLMAWPKRLAEVAAARGVAVEAPSPGVLRAFAFVWFLLAEAGAFFFGWPALTGTRAAPDAVYWLTGLSALWLPLSLAAAREICRGVNAIAPEPPPEGPVVSQATWDEDRIAIRGALRGGHPADRTWAEDMAARHARAGVIEAIDLAYAIQLGDQALLFELLSRPSPPLDVEGAEVLPELPDAD